MLAWSLRKASTVAEWCSFPDLHINPWIRSTRLDKANTYEELGQITHRLWQSRLRGESMIIPLLGWVARL